MADEARRGAFIASSHPRGVCHAGRLFAVIKGISLPQTDLRPETRAMHLENRVAPRLFAGDLIKGNKLFAAIFAPQRRAAAL